MQRRLDFHDRAAAESRHRGDAAAGEDRSKLPPAIAQKELHVGLRIVNLRDADFWIEAEPLARERWGFRLSRGGSLLRAPR